MNQIEMPTEYYVWDAML